MLGCRVTPALTLTKRSLQLLAVVDIYVTQNYKVFALIISIFSLSLCGKLEKGMTGSMYMYALLNLQSY